MKKIIYDFGACSGFNLKYFLSRADIVVAIEADPLAADIIKDKFASAISEGRLFVENVVVTELKFNDFVPFYISKLGGGHNQFPEPKSEEMKFFDKVELPSLTALEIISKYGKPYYIKIDVEWADAQILRSILSAGIRPPFISAESHTSEIFALLHGLGGYQSFNLVRGCEVLSEFKSFGADSKIKSGSDIEHLFEEHSSGPFGYDISRPWMTPDNFFYYLALDRLGWKDVHATTEIQANSDLIVSFSKFARRQIVQDYVPMFVRKTISKIRKFRL
jgi:FkbM family methyltransferase